MLPEEESTVGWLKSFSSAERGFLEPTKDEGIGVVDREEEGEALAWRV